MTTEALKAELGRLLGLTADNLLRTAVVVAELESRGEDLSDLKLGILPILREIAAGTLLPEVVVKYAGQPGILRHVAKESVERQELILSGVIPPRPVSSSSFGAGRQQIHKPAARPAGDDGERGDDEPAIEVPQLGIAGVAANASPRDIGDMAAELVAKCQDSRLAAMRFVDRLVEAKLLTPNIGTVLKTYMDRITPPRRVLVHDDDAGD